MIDNTLFWSASVEDLAKGYIFNEDSGEFICLICNEKFENGIIYPSLCEGIYYEAKKAIAEHIKIVHQSMFAYLLSLGKRHTGLSDIQRELLHYFSQGISDKEIAKKADSSASTIRNHRFKLKEKEKQAKVFLALMQLLDNGGVKEENFVAFHKGAKMVDERYAITELERKKF